MADCCCECVTCGVEEVVVKSGENLTRARQRASPARCEAAHCPGRTGRGGYRAARSTWVGDTENLTTRGAWEYGVCLCVRREQAVCAWQARAPYSPARVFALCDSHQDGSTTTGPSSLAVAGPSSCHSARSYNGVFHPRHATALCPTLALMLGALEQPAMPRQHETPSPRSFTTAPPQTAQDPSSAERERARRADHAGRCTFFILCFTLAAPT